jgi:hypothetical protein
MLTGPHNDATACSGGDTIRGRHGADRIPARCKFSWASDLGVMTNFSDS